MAHYKYVELELQEARMLADLTGVSFDLRTALEFAVKLKAVMEENPPDFILIDALTTAMLVRYSRPFTSGNRENLKDDSLANFDDEQTRNHKRLREIRNKHIAHSDSVLEESRPRAHYCVEKVREEGFTSISCQHGRVVGFSPEDADAVIELAEKMLEHVDARISEEKKKLLKIVRAMPIDVVLIGSGTAER